MEVMPNSSTPPTCPQCHQPVVPGAYYCSNCGKKLNDPPLSTSIGTQVWIYAFSIVLPVICFLAVGYWPAIKYVRAPEQKAKQIGYIAIGLMVLSTVVTFWYAYVWITQTIQSSLSSINSLE
jgi:hypothetical protein